MDFTYERNDDLMRVFREQLALSNYIVMPEIFKKVADSPAKRFWVSEERAAVVVSRMLAGKSFPRMRPTKREMFKEIFRRCMALRVVNPDLSLPELVSLIVNQPAPKFYYTPRTVGEIISRMKSGWYDKQYDRYKQYISGKRSQK